jgi:hypothetical protein
MKPLFSKTKPAVEEPPIPLPGFRQVTSAAFDYNVVSDAAHPILARDYHLVALGDDGHLYRYAWRKWEKIT